MSSMNRKQRLISIFDQNEWLQRSMVCVLCFDALHHPTLSPDRGLCAMWTTQHGLFHAVHVNYRPHSLPRRKSLCHMNYTAWSALCSVNYRPQSLPRQRSLCHVNYTAWSALCNVNYRPHSLPKQRSLCHVNYTAWSASCSTCELQAPLSS